MEDNVLKFIKGLNNFLSDFLAEAEGSTEPTDTRLVVAEHHEARTPADLHTRTSENFEVSGDANLQAEVQEVSPVETSEPSHVSKESEEPKEPVRLVPPGTYLEDPEPVPSAPDSPPPEEPLDTTEQEVGKEFPLTPQQVMTCKRRQLRELVAQYNLPISGPNGESADEMFVGPLRQAICTHLRTQEMMQAMKTSSMDSEEVPAEPTQQEAVAEKLARPPEETISDRPSQGLESGSETEVQPLGAKGKAFLNWVQEQRSGGLPQTNRMAEDLEYFFGQHLPSSRGPDRVVIDRYFEKMGCGGGGTISCTSCPNGGDQPVYCYGVFEEEVPHLDVKAASEGQFFRLDSNGEFRNQPTI